MVVKSPVIRTTTLILHQHRRMSSALGLKLSPPPPCESRELVKERDKKKESSEFTLAQCLSRQRHVLHGYEARVLRHIPKVSTTNNGRKQVAEPALSKCYSRMIRSFMRGSVLRLVLVGQRIGYTTAYGKCCSI